MKRPHVTCYLNVSAEGHIDGEFMKAEASEKATAVFRQRWLDMEPDAVIYGSSTMALFSGGRLKDPLPEAKEHFKREDFKAPGDFRRYYVAINTRGGLAYESNTIDKKGRGPHGVIHALTENAPDSYIAYLREKGISYVFCGEKEFDPEVLLCKLYEIFGIRKAILSGGAYADWTFLSHGLIDEITTMYLPCVDGGESHTLFKKTENDRTSPIALKLISAEKTEGDGLMVTYRPLNIRE